MTCFCCSSSGEYAPRRNVAQRAEFNDTRWWHTTEEDTVWRDAVRNTRMTMVVLLAVTATLYLQSFMMAGQAPPENTSEWTFDKDPVGESPGGATVFNGNWTVRPEARAPSPPNALCPTG